MLTENEGHVRCKPKLAFPLHVPRKVAGDLTEKNLEFVFSQGKKENVARLKDQASTQIETEPSCSQEIGHRCPVLLRNEVLVLVSDPFM